MGQIGWIGLFTSMKTILYLTLIIVLVVQEASERCLRKRVASKISQNFKRKKLWWSLSYHMLRPSICNPFKITLPRIVFIGKMLNISKIKNRSDYFWSERWLMQVYSEHAHKKWVERYPSMFTLWDYPKGFTELANNYIIIIRSLWCFKMHFGFKFD